MIIVCNFFRAGNAGDDKSTLAKRRAEMNEIVQFTLRTLRENSPVGGADDKHTGLYRDSHTLFVNGNDQADLATWLPGSEIEIANPVPYARIIELGDKHLRVAMHVYELSAQTAQQKYGDIAKIELVYKPITFGASQFKQFTGTFGRASSRRGSRSPGWLARQPVIVIKEL